MEVRKEVIRTGRHAYIDQDGKTAYLDATPEKIDHYFNAGKEMLAAGLPIPVPLEHDPKAHPLNAAELAAEMVKTNAGFVKGYERDTIKDPKTGEDIHRVVSVLDIKDPKVGEKIKQAAIPFVSPWINSFTDGKGKRWEEVISHVALTTRPRITEQAPFESVAMALSAALPTPKLPDAGIFISRAGLLKKDGKPRFPMAFSLMAGVKLSDKEIEAIEEESENAKEEIEEEEDDVEEEIESEERESPLDAVGAEDNDISIHETIGHLLKACGLHPPDGMSEETFERDIYETLMAKVQEMGAEAHNADAHLAGDEDKEPEQNPLMQETPPMYMSLEEIQKKVKDPAAARMMFAIQEENRKNRDKVAAIEKKQLADAAAIRNTRIERLAKRVSPAVRDKIIQHATNAALSLDGSGKIVDPMDTMLNVLEEGIPDLPALLRGDAKLSDLKLSTPPDDGVISADRAEQIANGQLGRYAGTTKN